MGGISNISKSLGFSKKSTATAKPSIMSTPFTAAAKGTEEEDGAELATTSTMLGIKKKGKKALVTQPAAANVGGDGGVGLNIPKG
jgi:hypothetical protein